MPPVIRPFNPPAIPPSATPAAKPAAETRAAQRAFFQQALGDSTPVRAAPVAAPHTPLPPVEAQMARVRTQPLPAEPPTRIMRPGSFVDVKV